MKKTLLSLILCFLVISSILAQQSTSFSYQGKLNSSSAPANGTYDFKFELYSVLTNGTPIGTVNSNGVQVVNGIFNVQLDFGANAFDGNDRYLEISVKLPAEGSYTTLTPRQKISSVPYAIKAIAADTATVAQTANNATNLGGISANNYLLNNGDGSQLINVNGGFKWNVVPDSVISPQLAQPNNGYISTSGLEKTFILPANPQIGDVFRFAAAGMGGWIVETNNSSQVISSEFWKRKGPPRHWLGVASSADGTRLAAAPAGGKIHYSIDSGNVWTELESFRNWSGIALSDDGRKMAAIDYGGQIWIGSDSVGFWLWQSQDSNRPWNSIACSADCTKLVATVSNGQIYTSSGSTTWTARETNRAWSGVAISSNGSKMVAIVNGGQIYTSADSGVSWTARATNQSWNSVASSADGTKLVATVNNGQIYTSTDSGVNWTPRDTTRSWTSVASSSDGVRLIATAGIQSYISKDSGVTWVSKNQTVSPGLGKIACSDDARRCISFSSSNLVTSQAAGGLNWQLMPNPETQYNTMELVYIGNNMFLTVDQQ